MGSMSLQELEKVIREYKRVRRKIAPLVRRKRRAGAFKTRARIQAQIDTVMKELGEVWEKIRLSWTEGGGS